MTARSYGAPTLPEGREWTCEIKLDGFRLEVVKKKGETALYSRRGNILESELPLYRRGP